MRILIVLFALPACTSSWGNDLSISPAGGPPLGVGLVQTYTVMQTYCDGGIDSSCDPTPPHAISVAVVSGSAASVAQVGSATFDLLGAAEGNTTIRITGEDGASMDQTIDVAAVGSTRIWVPLDSSEVYPPVHVFANASLTIQQESLGVGGTQIAGEAPLQATSGASLVAIAGDQIAVGATAGTVQITAAVATLELDVVDQSALADFTVDGSRAPDLALYTSSGTTSHWLLGTDAGGGTIVGAGPEPTFTIADPSIVAVTGSSASDNSREIDIAPLAAGETTIQVKWGSATNTIGVSVAAR